MTGTTMDPRMMNLVWTDRHDYEMLLFKRPVCTQAQPSCATSTVPKATSAKVSSVMKPAPKLSSVSADGKNLVAELEAARGFIRASLQKTPSVSTLETLQERATRLETSNMSLRQLVEDLTKQIEILERKAQIDSAIISTAAVIDIEPNAKPAPKKEESDDDDDFKFSDDDEDDAPKESAMEKMKRLNAEKKAAEAKASPAKKKGAPVLKSNVVIDVKPWDDETDLNEMEKAVRSIEMEGLIWGNSKFVEMAFGIKKLQISTCIVDELVGLYDLEDRIQAFEDLVQSTDIVAHNKI